MSVEVLVQSFGYVIILPGTPAIGTTRVGITHVTVLGALLWATTLGGAGDSLGSLLEVVLKDLESLGTPLLVGTLGVVVVWVVHRHPKTAPAGRQIGDTAVREGDEQ